MWDQNFRVTVTSERLLSLFFPHFWFKHKIEKKKKKKKKTFIHFYLRNSSTFSPPGVALALLKSLQFSPKMPRLLKYKALKCFR